MASYLKFFPKPFLDDLVAGACVPFVGAGFSRNAVLPRGSQMPLWDDLGRMIAGLIPDYTYTNAMEAVSAYCHEFSRAKLVEELSQMLHLGTAQPGAAHEAFCKLPFDLVCTTNFDFLLEAAYQSSQKYCRPIVDGDTLAVRVAGPGVTLLKLHGDLHHPASLVATEEDYDGFVERHALVATYVANLLITKTPLFVGYSLDDPDFRLVWQVIKDRLGSLRRQGYALTVGASSQAIRRFERRGVKVINLSGADTGRVLAAAFIELRDYWLPNLLRSSSVTTEQPLAQFVLPWDSSTRLCLFAMPASLQAVYKDLVFPIAERHGFVPVTATDVLVPGDAISAKIEALIERADVVVVDVSSAWTATEAVTATRKGERLLVISEEGGQLPDALRNLHIVGRPENFGQDPAPEAFLARVDEFFSRMEERAHPFLEEPARLLRAKEYRAAVVAAFSVVEFKLRSLLDPRRGTRAGIAPVRDLLESAVDRGLIDRDGLAKWRHWQRLRNEVVHSDATPSKQVAEQLVRDALDLVQRLDSQSP